ncbi:glutathione S-transferase PARB [Ricinus communis]|uniref:glutathione transferase n=1 Tax=Ricinus communis TaxID=3988 RepID=B9T0U9_RICCO|nr:glutathione S-transferase PARB [Ricinus communis]EEF30505.1 glutathione-s-transferase theta, gst, putative [Ricinus communis]|eukprot:XP_002531868.1 glutathione S-transferase PARB [Ricinus communis]
MAAVKVHGSPLSTATQRVLACLYEKETEFEFVNINMAAGEHKQEPFISLNPFGQVPVLEHGDLKLFESRAITQYLAHEYSDKGTQLLCPGMKTAILSVWMEAEAHQFEQPASKLNWEIVYKPFFKLTTDPAAVQENEATLTKVLDVYESRLAQSKYLACGCFTLADLHHLPNLQLLMGTECKKLIDARPHVSAWATDITARPAWAKVLAMQQK